MKIMRSNNIYCNVLNTFFKQLLKERATKLIILFARVFVWLTELQILKIISMKSLEFWQDKYHF